jgi:hypothetical protein
MDETVRAINAGAVPRAYQEGLQARVNELVNEVNCPPPPEPEEEEEEEQEEEPQEGEGDGEGEGEGNGKGKGKGKDKGDGEDGLLPTLPTQPTP